ncbi:peroxidase [Coprinellus micaceus]|uniref:Peroxidase n=1 Tax=Coprinellus micaceus TaxID=71717 RepID=A0A4Y7RJ63_COPMI|nr:peroxidase [Coprinellus micaceus]
MRFAALVSLVAASVAIASPAAHLKKRASCPGGQTVDDAQCCIWFDVLDDLQTKLFNGAKCENGVHKALRLQFHDSIGFSPALTASGQFGGGGSDGSIIEHADVELTFPPNGNLGGIVASERSIALAHNVSFADMIQFAAAAGVANCPGAPRLEFLAGRPFTSQASPPGLVPGPGNTVTSILNRMADAGFSADETVDLLASHSIAAQQGLNAGIAGSPFDSTPDRFDTQFFIETLLKGVLNPGPTTGFAEVLSPLPGEFRMQSDFAIARDPRTSCRWQELADNPQLMRTAFRTAMAKLAALGNDRSSLVDCSSVIPNPADDDTEPTLPGGKVADDIEGSCAATPFPVLPIAPGPTPTIPAVVI